MDFVLHDNGIMYYTSASLDAVGVKHMFTTRIGGVSVSPFDSLNFAEGSGDIRDSSENVLKNYSIAASELGFSASDVCRAYQAHTANVLICDKSTRGMGITYMRPENGIDALVTSCEGVVLSVRTADCVPILLCDPVSRVIAAVHSGWRGTAQRISERAVEAMTSLGAERKRIIAAIGPHAGVCCYEVGEEIREYFGSDCFRKVGGRTHLDLSAANRDVLASAGIKDENIHDIDICTVCNRDSFFSHRRDGVNRGVMGAFIVL